MVLAKESIRVLRNTKTASLPLLCVSETIKNDLHGLSLLYRADVNKLMLLCDQMQTVSQIDTQNYTRLRSQIGEHVSPGKIYHFRMIVIVWVLLCRAPEI